MMKKINHKIKSLSIELDKSIKLIELNSVIKKFEKDTDDKYEVNISLTFSYTSGTLTINRTRKPYLKLVKNINEKK